MDLPLLNNQPAEKPDRHPDGQLDVHSMFYTLQGEGPFAGRPAVFVRLAGCNLQCPACFYGNTLVKMADFSNRLIAEVRAGDEVLSYDEGAGTFVPRRVVRTMSRTADTLYRIDTGGNKKTYATGEHPFLVRGRGWTEVTDLRPGDHILRLSLSELRRMNNPMHRPESVAKGRRTFDQHGHVCPLLDPVARENARKAAQHRMRTANPMKDPAIAIKGYLARKDRGEMSTVEHFVMGIGHDLGLCFTGGGDLVVRFKVPDFRIEGTNKLIEVWDATQTEFYGRDAEWIQARHDLYQQAGYQVLFLPCTPYPLHDRVGTRKPHIREARDREVSRVRRLIAEYARNGECVQSITRIDRTVNPKAWCRLAGTVAAPITVYNLEVEGTHTYLADGMVAHNCDTEYTQGRVKDGPDVLVHRVTETFPPLSRRRLVVLTGGEPFRQNPGPFVRKLMEAGYEVQVETNGTLNPYDWPFGVRGQSIVCSPKTPRVAVDLPEHVAAWKYVLQAGKVSSDGLPSSSLGMEGAPARPPSWHVDDGKVWVQPMDDKDPDRNRDNLKAAVASCLRFGYRLTIQQHKEADLP
jgi:7-carboxy-7-deazaguanine synthase